MIHAGCQIKRLQNNCGEPWTCGLNRLLKAPRSRDWIPEEYKNCNFFFFVKKFFKIMKRNWTYYSKTRMISWRFWKTSLRWTILLDSAQADSIEISCRISIEQSTPHRTLDENFAAYITPVSRWVHLRTVAKRPLQKKKRKLFKNRGWFHKLFLCPTSSRWTLMPLKSFSKVGSRHSYFEFWHLKLLSK